MKTPLKSRKTREGSSLRRMVSRRGVAHIKRNGPGFGFFAMMETRSRIVAVGKTRKHWKQSEADAIAMLKAANAEVCRPVRQETLRHDFLVEQRCRHLFPERSNRLLSALATMSSTRAAHECAQRTFLFTTRRTGEAWIADAENREGVVTHRGNGTTRRGALICLADNLGAWANDSSAATARK